jgi:hypothetical protein
MLVFLFKISFEFSVDYKNLSKDIAKLSFVWCNTYNFTEKLDISEADKFCRAQVRAGKTNLTLLID